MSYSNKDLKDKLIEMMYNYNDLVAQVFNQIDEDAKLMSRNVDGVELLSTPSFRMHIRNLKSVVLKELTKIETE